MSETRKPLYSPVQVAMSVLLGGPLAGTHLFWSNFISLGMAKEAKRALFIGLAATIGIYVWIIFTPKKAVPGALITLLVGLTFRFLVETYQLKKEAIEKSPDYSFQSNWKVVLLGLLSMVITIAFVYVVLILLALAGVEVPN